MRREWVCSPAFRRNFEGLTLRGNPPKGGTTNLIFFLLFLLFTGCATVPFEVEPKADFQGLEPTAVVENFDAVVGQQFELLESVVFKFFGKEIAGLGALVIDPAVPSYALTCMTPTGITVFSVRGVGDEVEALFVPPPMEKHRKYFAEAVGRDLRRIYLGWTPSAEADVKHKKHRMIFSEKRADETVEHTFSGQRRLLTEKRFSKGWKTRCAVRYFEYEEVNGKLYPMGIILHNKQFHYRMILRVKEVYGQKDGFKTLNAGTTEYTEGTEENVDRTSCLPVQEWD